MLRKRALRRILVTSMSLFIIMTIYLIPEMEKTLNTNMEFDYVSNLSNSSIYLLDENDLLVKTKVFLDENKTSDKVLAIVDSLTLKKDNIFPDKLRGVINSDVKVNKVSLDNDTVIVDFNKKILNINKNSLEKVVEALVYSITELNDVNNVKITVDSCDVDGYSGLLNRSMGINKEYDYTSFQNLTCVVIYYNEIIDDDIYYVPVTKYINTDKDKVDIIVEELTTSYIYQDNLGSILDEELKLTNKEFIDDLLILDFNLDLSKAKEEVLYTLSYSLFDNYDINTISFKCQGKEYKNITKRGLV